METARRPQDEWREYRIELHGKFREDGSLFVTSPSMGPFSAVITNGCWDEVLGFLKDFLEINAGPVRNLKLIHDASELMASEHEYMPPAYVVAEGAVLRTASSRG